MDKTRVLIVAFWAVYNTFRKDTQKKIEGWLFVIVLILLNIWLESII